MSPTQLLRGIRRSGISTNAARVLLAIASGARRQRDILAATELSEYCVRVILDQFRSAGWVVKTNLQATAGGGSGRVTCYDLTAAGGRQAQRIFELGEQPVAPTPHRNGFPLALRVTSSRGISFL